MNGSNRIESNRIKRQLTHPPNEPPPDNEKINDLLDPTANPDNLKVRESPKLGVHVTGLTKKQVASAAQVCRVLVTGFTNRTVSATTYNAESSRSHAVSSLTCLDRSID